MDAKMSKALKVLTVAVLAFLISPQIVADGRFKKVKARDHSCVELIEIVNTEQNVLMKGFGSTTVSATGASACKVDRRCQLGRFICVPFKTNWRTSDKRFCTVGFSCMTFSDRSG